MRPQPSGGHPRRQDIDILRAVAVLAVILFHLDIPWAAAGYLGVDVFFVISGFLITQLIVSDLGAGKFSFVRFYARRMARLTPAFVVTTLATAAFAVVLLPWQELDPFLESAAAASTYVSNIYFWLQSGYFDADSITKPILHTWSLAVEEQFYILWPAMLFFAGVSRARPVLIVLGAGSLVAAFLVLPHHPDAVFYLLPFRVFEFVGGAILVGWRESPVWSPARRNVVGAILLAGLLAVMAMSRDQASLVPEILAVICSAGLIYLQPPFLSSRAFWARTLNRVGLISYSAYLIHWPLIVFLAAQRLDGPTELEKWALVAVTLVLAEASWRWVEQPWQKRARGRYPKALAAGASVLAVCALAFFLVPSSVLRKPLIETISIPEVPIKEYRAAIRQRGGELMDTEVEGPLVLFLGDSHALDGLVAMGNVEPRTFNVRLVGSSCHPLFVEDDEELERLYQGFNRPRDTATQCKSYSKSLYRRLAARDADLIVFSENWQGPFDEFLPGSLERLRELDIPMLVLGRNQKFRIPAARMVHQLANADDVNARAWERRRPSIDDRLRQAVGDRAFFASKESMVCIQTEACDYIVDGQSTYIDEGHWTWKGLEVFGPRLLNDPAVKASLAAAWDHYRSRDPASADE